MKKRENKSKDQIRHEMAQQEKERAKVDRDKYIAKTAFPFVTGLKTIYDAQTAFNAASGYVQLALVAAEAKLKVSDLVLETDKLPKGEVEDAVKAIIQALMDVPAKDVGDLLQRMGQKLPEYVANIHLKDAMTITAEEFIA